MSNPRESIIEVRDLKMTYGRKDAVAGISFDVDRGVIHGFIGPNGAGKTTTIRILATLQVPSAGGAWIDGVNVVTEPKEVRRRLGYMPDYFGVYEGLSVTEYLEFFALAHRLAPARRRSAISDVVELTDLGSLLEVEVHTLSKGMRQRLCLAQTLLHEPDLLILDEPANGLDPRARIEFRGLLTELRRLGKTIFLSSHILSELSPICDSVSIIEMGALVAHGPLEQIQQRIRGSDVTFEIRLVEESDAVEVVLSQLPGVSRIYQEGRSVRFDWEGEDSEIHQVWGALSAKKIAFTSVKRHEDDLEKLFMNLTTGEVQ
ncbi:MAG: ABC transporter ATP-binding protein [Planctomycetes bacterium]|jgi:ABC-2 type transport system ATP-binding protein|nr:ABC transporter ATP-binding protein [Planctomycetota bacterium]MBT6784031.1 ABC transporter ATP-binding protein [Planctomycetota bacterium]MBT7130171.1 ABC transporter ATP-binding protein [Planctomycetota bacterium]